MMLAADHAGCLPQMYADLFWFWIPYRYVWNCVKPTVKLNVMVLWIFFYSYSAFYFIRYVNQQIYSIKYSKIQFIKYNSWEVTTLTCFGTGVPSSGNLLKHRTQVQLAPAKTMNTAQHVHWTRVPCFSRILEDGHLITETCRSWYREL